MIRLPSLTRQATKDASSPSSQSGGSWETEKHLNAARDLFGESSLTGTASKNRPRHGYSGKAHRFVTSTFFEILMLTVILLNAAQLGYLQALELEGRNSEARRLEVSEHCFLVVYLIEFTLRFAADGQEFFMKGWAFFDGTLVAIGIAHKWIFEVATTANNEGWGAVGMLRVCRVFRLMRTLRFLMWFKELWMLVRGLLTAVRTMVYTLLMLAIMLYIFSTIAIEVITKSDLAEDPDLKEHVEFHFGSLPECMLTLLQFVTLDSINLIYVPLVRRNWSLAFLFIAILLTVSIALMNLITAIIVNSAMEEALHDKEIMRHNEDLQRRKMMKKLRTLFFRLDEDGSGEVSMEELKAITVEELRDLHSVLGIKDPIEIFKLLDVDGSGTLKIDEFCDGIWEVAEDLGNLQLKVLSKNIVGMRKRVDKAVLQLERVLMYMQSRRSRHARSDEARSSADAKGNSWQRPQSPQTPPLPKQAETNEQGERSQPAASTDLPKTLEDLEAPTLPHNPSVPRLMSRDESPYCTFLEDETPAWARDLSEIFLKEVEELKLAMMNALDPDITPDQRAESHSRLVDAGKANAPLKQRFLSGGSKSTWPASRGGSLDSARSEDKAAFEQATNSPTGDSKLVPVRFPSRSRDADRGRDPAPIVKGSNNRLAPSGANGMRMPARAELAKSASTADGEPPRWRDHL